MYPINVTNVLAQLAIEGLYTAKWTKKIDEEWVRAILKTHSNFTQEQANKRLAALHDAIPDWEVDEDQYLGLIDALNLPDPNDRHVLAAAIAGHADCIVTFNTKDFPTEEMEKRGIEVLHPDDFISLQLTLEPVPALTAIKHIRARLKNPPKTAQEYIELLERVGLVSTAEKLKDAIELI
jgi:predicted nucleic acid-binding protein